MVAKISTGSSLFGVLSYNQEKIDAGQAKILSTNKVLLPMDKSLNLAFCMKSFENHLPKDVKTEKPVVHISLNPHPDDVLTDLQLSQIAKDYLDKMGYGEQPFVVYKHEDIDRHHIHIVSLKVDENGRKINDRFEFKRSKEATIELEAKYNLHAAEKQNQEHAPKAQKVDYKSGNIKKQLANLTKALASSYRFQNIGEYKTLLSLYNIGLEEVQGEHEGRPYHGIIYFALDKRGRKKGQAIKSSTIGKSVGAEALKRRCYYNSQFIKKQQLKAPTEVLIKLALSQARSKKNFISQLKKQGIDTVFRENEKGRIYGITFIDHHRHTALNGSRYGKAFSANVLNEKFGQTLPVPPTADNLYDKAQNEELTSVMFSFLDFDTQGENYEEEAFIYRMKRKKRKN